MMKEEDDILIKTSFWSRPTHDGSLSLIILIISTTTTLIHATTIFLDNQKKTPCYKSSGILERRYSPFLEEGRHTGEIIYQNTKIPYVFVVVSGHLHHPPCFFPFNVYHIHVPNFSHSLM